jgi:ankyrin repeat protein
MDKLEERNEMSETPLIREAADGHLRNVQLLLEAGADVEAQQQNAMGFNAINMAVCTICDLDTHPSEHYLLQDLDLISFDADDEF